MKRNKTPERDREAIARALAKQSEKKLILLETEYQRQRDLTGRKVGSVYTKGTLLVGAAGVLGGVSVTNSVGSPYAWIGIVGMVAYVVAAALGLMSMRPMSGDEVEPDDAVIGSIEFSRLELKRSLILSHSDALAGYTSTVKKRNRHLVAGFIVLTMAWTMATTATTLGYLFPEPATPVQIEIVK